MKPKVKLTGQDGNVFNLVAICSKALKSNGQKDQIDQMKNRIVSSKSYDEALSIMADYCEIY